MGKKRGMERRQREMMKHGAKGGVKNRTDVRGEKTKEDGMREAREKMKR